MLKVPMDLAQRLTGWHSSMWDPIYSVSSCTLAKRDVAEDTFRDALSNMEKTLGRSGFEEHQNEVMEIVSAMKSVLGESSIHKTIVRAMARYLWSCSWADVMERRGEACGGEITHLAPETPPEALEWAVELIKAFEEMNGITIEKVVEAEKPDDIYDYGGVVAGNFLGFGIESMGDYKTPYCESSQLWDLVPEEEEG